MKFSTSVNFLFKNLPFLKRFRAAGIAGFDGVEIQFLESNSTECAQAAAEANMPIILLNVDMGDLLSGGCGLSGVPGQENTFLEAVRKAVSDANIMNAKYIHLGPSRVPDGASRAECLSVYKNNLDRIINTGLCNDTEAKFLIEPMNNIDIPDALFCDINEVSNLIRAYDTDHFGLLFDIYHVSKSGGNIIELYKKNADIVEHIQFSDVPNRGEPGSGELDFHALFSDLHSLDYGGWYGAEYFPTRPTLETLGWMKYRQGNE